MKAKIDSVKIEMSHEDAEQLKKEMIAMISEIKSMSESLVGYFDEASLRELYPKVNELLNIINIREHLPF